jgi:hypothetical protein
MDLIDIHKKLWEDEFKDESYQSKWNEIRDGKLKEIEKAFDSLSFINGAQRLFGSTKETSFKTFTEYLKEDFKNKTGNESPAELLFQAESSTEDDPLLGLIRSLSRSESFLQIRCLLSSPSYTPPDKISDILSHLYVLWVHFKELRPGPQFINDMYMDLSLTKLVGVVSRTYERIVRHGERELSRIFKSTQTKRKKAGTWKQFVQAIYEHGDSIAPGTGLSDAIRMIQGQFEKSKGDKNAKWGAVPNDMNTPSRDSIIDLLTKEGFLAKDFEKRGNYWFKKM